MSGNPPSAEDNEVTEATRNPIQEGDLEVAKGSTGPGTGIAKEGTTLSNQIVPMRSLLVTIFLLFLQVAIIFLLAACVAGSPKMHIKGSSQDIYDYLMHIDYQSVSIYYHMTVTSYDNASVIYTTADFGYNMGFSLNYAASKTSLNLNNDNKQGFLSYHDYVYEPGCSPGSEIIYSGDYINGRTAELTTLSAAVNICSNKNLANTCKNWGQASTAYFATAFALSIVSLVLIVVQGWCFIPSLNWASVALDILSMIFVAATFGMSTNCVGKFAELLAGLNTPCGKPIRVGSRPVISAAREGVQMLSALYHWVNRSPWLAIRSMAPGSWVGWP